MTKNIETMEFVDRLRHGGPIEVEAEFSKFYARLHAMVAMRMDHRIRARVDAEDILQEVFLEFQKSIHSYLENPDTTPYLWLRAITARHLHVVHRRHLKVQSRSVNPELGKPVDHACPDASSASLASYLLGRFSTPSQKLLRVELQQRVQQALTSLSPIDREILALRHFEMMTNQEIAMVLEISEAAASNRYFRALKRIKIVLQDGESELA